MPTTGEVDDALERLAGYASRVNDERVEAIEMETRRGDQVRGYALERGNHTYQLLASPAWEHATVQYEFDVPQAMAYSETGTLTRESLQSARESLGERFAELGDAKLMEVRLALLDVALRSSCAVDLETGREPYQITGYTVRRDLFPYDDGLSLQTFNDVVQEVVNIGWRTKDLLVVEYGMIDFLGEGSADGADPEIGFQ